MTKTSIIYVDGFNLYYGFVKNTNFKWLDLEKYFKLLLPDDDIQKIYYFTALTNRISARIRQETYLQALEMRSLVEIRLGKFKRKSVRCRASGCTFSGNKMFTSYEEKRTDVNIAIQMLDDAYQNKSSKTVLVSGDSDLVPSLARIKHRFPEQIVSVYIPATDTTRGAATEIRNVADKHKTLPLNIRAKAQFPSKIDDGAGGWIAKPTEW